MTKKKNYKYEIPIEIFKFKIITLNKLIHKILKYDKT